MSTRLLIVDDDHHLLAAFRRQLGQRFPLVCAQSGADAVAAAKLAVDEHDPFAVVLCDMRMPGMDGIETLRQIRELSPETVRMMLTGNADQQTAIEAINRGSIFRFYTKPYPLDALGEALQDGIEQHRLITAERELLEQTVNGSIKVLTDLVSLNDPVAHGVATRLREWVKALTGQFNMPQRWPLEIAASLVSLGEVAIPPELVAKRRRGERLTAAEQSVFDHAPETGRDLIANIPRLAKVAQIVYLQDRGYDGSGFPADGPVGDAIPLDARLLKILKDLAEAADGRPLTEEVFDRLARHKERYDPKLFGKVCGCLKALADGEVPAGREVPVAALRAGQLLLSDIRLVNGHLILPANTRLSQPHIARLGNLRRIFAFSEPVWIAGDGA